MITLEEFRSAFKTNQPRDARGRWAAIGGGPGTNVSGSFTDGEIAALSSYQGGSSSMLRTANDPGALEFQRTIARQQLEQPENARQIRELDSAMARSETTADAVLYRGVQPALANVPEPGQSYVDYSFVSTSADQNVAAGFGPMVLEVRVPAGTRAVNVSQALGSRSQFEQSEFLLDRGMTFRVVSKTPTRAVVEIVEPGSKALGSLLAQIKTMKWEAKANVSAIVDSFDWGEWHSDMRDAIEKPFSDVVLEQAERAAELVGDAFDRDDPFVRRTTTEYVGKLIKQLDKTTKSEVSDLIRRELEAGTQGSPLELGDKIAAAVRRKFADYADWRADRIARTETANAYNMGSLLAWQAAGVTHVLVSDGDQDAECAAADGQIWTLGRAMANLTAHPNCERAFSPLDGDGKAFDFGGRTK
jgi:hypothetical protein